MTEKFAAFLWQITPIVPVLPTPPANKPFAVNKVCVERHLHTVNVIVRISICATGSARYFAAEEAG
jgi:hypothetical protein